ncbi:hypothetical protein SiH_2349 [Sulfolobus islandicus HVE10/4]|uniref:Uncharacterized protein n=2 Tax=Saccharolobus islandicus TaxID=43080 RepID=F0ND52_SACI5|nr:hypothetical protein SiH_2349 [Sulfolobus islandicus HVE10/4]ADX86349.1 hypothetical protein SiRe_2299 [Sulfolobus islandicus REY15A]
MVGSRGRQKAITEGIHHPRCLDPVKGKMILFAPPSVSLSPQSGWRRAVLTSLEDISTKGYLNIEAIHLLG